MIEARNSLTISRGSRAAIVGISLAAILMSCSNLLTGNDIKTKIGTDVAAANAASVTVTVQATPNVGGTLSLSGQQTEKVGIPFSLTATPASAYVFGGWTATGSGNVTFGSASASMTTVTIGAAASNVVITATFTARPQVATATPTIGNTVVRNQPIVVNFSKAMAASSFAQAGAITITYDAINPTTPNPHTIFSSGTVSSYFSYSVNSTQLTLTPLSTSPATGSPNGYMPSNSTITVTIASSLTDSAGNVMSSGYSFYFYTNGTVDSNAPTISSVSVLNGGASASTAATFSSTFASTPETCYAVDSPTVTLQIAAASNSSSATVQSLVILETGNTSGVSSTTTTTVGFSTAYVYTLVSADQGAKQLQISVVNSTGQTCAAPTTIYLYLDTTAPTVTGLALASSATYTNLQTVPISFSANDTGSGVYEYQVSESSTAGSTWLTSVPSSYTFGSSTNGTKTVYIFVKDYAGNVANYSTASIVFDNTPPSTALVSIATSNSNPAYAKMNDTITLRFMASDNGSGLAAESASIVGHSVAPTLVSGSTYQAMYTMSLGDTAEEAITYSFNASDNAGNATSNSTVTSSITYDPVPPTVSIGSPSKSYVNNGTTFTYTVTFGSAIPLTPESNATLVSGISLIGTDTTGASVSSVATSGSGTNTVTATVTVKAGTGSGTLGIQMPASSVSDAAGNASAATSATSLANVYNTPPTITSATASGGTTYPILSPDATDGSGPGLTLIYYGDTQADMESESHSVAYGSSVNLTALPADSNIYFYVVDAAGNPSTDCYELLWGTTSYTTSTDGGPKGLGLTTSTGTREVTSSRVSSASSSRTLFTTPVFTDPVSSQSSAASDQAASSSKSPSGVAMQPVSYDYATTSASRPVSPDTTGLSLLQRRSSAANKASQAPATKVSYTGAPASAAAFSPTTGTGGAAASSSGSAVPGSAPSAADSQAAAQGTSTSGSQASASAPTPSASGSSSSQGSASAPVKGASPAGQKTPAPVNNSVPRPDLFVGQTRERRDEASEESWDDEE